MIETTIPTQDGSQLTFWLLSLSPDWSEAVRVTVSRPVNVEDVLAAHEVRRPTADALRWKQEFTIIPSGSVVDTLDVWLASHKTDLVGVPLWPAVTGARQSRDPFRASLWVAVSYDFTRVEVFRDESGVPSWCSADDMVAPMILGRIESRTVQMLTPSLAAYRVTHSEACPAEFSVGVRSIGFPMGPRHTAADPFDLFPGRVNYSSPSQSAKIDIERADIGFGREQEERATAGPSREFTVECPVTSLPELGALVSFFESHTAAVPFWVSGISERFTLTRDLAAGSVVVPAAGHNVAAGEWLAFCGHNQTPAFARVAETGPAWVRMETAPGDLRAGDTLISRLSLVRFRTDRLSLDFDQPGMASAKVDFRELIPEAESADWTVAGQNIGAISPKVWLYQIENVGTVERWTSHEREVKGMGFVWLPGRITHGERNTSVSGSRDSMTVQVGLTSSDLARSALHRRITGRLRVSVWEGDLVEDSVTGPEAIFSGDADAVSLSGVTVTLSCQPWPEISTLRIPRFRIQPGCNHVVYRGACGLIEEDWKWTATVSNPGVPGYPFTFEVSGLDGQSADAEENWFAGGWVEVGTDKVPIRSSTASDSGTLSITLARDPIPFPRVGQAVALFPGCDGRFDTCTDKFDNRINFGGHPHVPASNPSLVKLSSAINGGKK